MLGKLRGKKGGTEGDQGKGFVNPKKKGGNGFSRETAVLAYGKKN